MAVELPHTRRELRALGIDDQRLRTLLRRREWLAVGYDRYVPTAAIPVDPTLVAAAGGGVALSHLTAARAWGLPVDDDGAIHVQIRADTRRRATPGRTRVHRTRRWDAIRLDGVPVTPLARTLADVAASEPLHRSVPVLDAGLRHTTRGAVAAATPHGGRPAARSRAALALADERAESPLESRLRLLLVRAGLPPHDLQHEVRCHGRFVARVDLWYEGLVVEADGFAFHSARADYRRDRRRQRALVRLGLAYLPFAWEDVHHHPEQVVEDVRSTLGTLAA